MATSIKQCSFDAFGSIAHITYMPHMEKGHGADKTFNAVGDTLILSAYI